MSLPRQSKTVMAVDSKDSIVQQLDKIATSLSPEDLEATLPILRKIFDNIIQHPNDDKYRQIKLANKTFSSKVWRYLACEELMKMSGWVVEDDHVRLKDDSHVHAMSQALESLCKERNFPQLFLFANPPSIFGKQSHQSNSSITEAFVPPTNVSEEIMSVVAHGNGNKLRNILNQYSISAIRRMCLFGESSLILSAFLIRQIGIVRMLVEEYGIDANTLNMIGNPCFFELFTGCDSSDTCQLQIISTIREFKLNVQANGDDFSVIHYAVLYKLFTVLKFLVEECQVDVNQPIRSGHRFSDNFASGGTALHIAYSIDEDNIAKYLIEHGADQKIIDSNGKIPQECMPPFRFPNYYSVASDYLIKRSVVFGNNEAAAHYNQLLRSGMTELEAIYDTAKIFTDKHTDHRQPLDPETTPTMNKLNHYITDMAPSYYAIGLELDVSNSKLKVIRSDPSLVNLQQKCHKMLEVWLETDTSASWKKLCDALQDPEVGLCALAGQIKKTM